jgi:hypothetical protein
VLPGARGGRGNAGDAACCLVIADRAPPATVLFLLVVVVVVVAWCVRAFYWNSDGLPASWSDMDGVT